MKKACIGFEMGDATEAYRHMQYTVVKDYGSYANGHYLHTWDDGKRMLVRCNNCGGYIGLNNTKENVLYGHAKDWM